MAISISAVYMADIMEICYLGPHGTIDFTDSIEIL